jgi:putative DNA primase/helicase
MSGEHTNDAGNAARFCALFGERVRYSRAEDRWLVSDGKRWVYGSLGRVYQLGKQAMQEYLLQAIEAGKDGQIKHAVRSLDHSRITAMLNSASADLEIDIEQLDAHPLLLNFTNGTLDLETGTLREHRREDFLTKIIQCDYDPAAQAPTFQKVLAHATGGSQPLLDYLEQVFGYAVTGKTGEKAFFVFYGPSNTGKTTVLNAIRETFQEYSTTIQIETLMATRHGELSNNQQADLADLRGVRFAQTSEVESGQRLKEGLIKRITQGVGKIKAARKFQDPIQFTESHKLFIDANHRPEIRDGVGVWERLHCVPFMRVVPPEEQDQGIHEKLTAEDEGIAAWVVAGALKWLKAGRLVKPKEVLAAGQEYRESQDVMGEWIAECCELDPNGWAESSKLLESFNQYADKNGGHGLDARKFKDSLLARGGITFRKRKTANVFEGIGLKSEFESDQLA